MKYFSMFSGIGGFELGIQRTQDNRSKPNLSGEWKENFRSPQDISNKGDKPNNETRCIGFSEIDKYSIQTYQKHFPAHKGYGDAKDIDWREVDDFELLVAGFPCQSFSIAGKRKGFEDTRGTLFFEICRCLEAKRPSLCLLENVKGLLSHDEGRTFSTILSSLSGLGYWYEWQVLNSKHFGVPQNRERAFIVGHLGEGSGQKVFPVGETSKEPDQWASSLQHPGHSGGNYRGMNMIKTADFRNDEGLRIRGEDIAPCLATRKHSETDISTMPPIVLDLYNKKGHSDRTPALTEPHHNTLRLLQNNKIRRLTPTECERLQGFPDGWTIGSDTQRYKQLGNAVTVNVIEAIASELHNLK